MPHLEPEPRLELQQPTEQGAVLAPVAGRASRAGSGHVRVLRAVEDSPGLGFRELARRTGIPSGTLAHHVSLLTRSGAVWTKRHGARVLHFPAPRQDEPAPVRVVLEEHVLDALDRDLLAWVREGPRVQKAVVARFSGHPRATVQHRLARLVKWGFLTASASGRCRVYQTLDADACGFAQ